MNVRELIKDIIYAGCSCDVMNGYRCGIHAPVMALESILHGETEQAPAQMDHWIWRTPTAQIPKAVGDKIHIRNGRECWLAQVIARLSDSEQPAPANFTRDCPDCEEEISVKGVSDVREHSIQDGEHLITCWCHYEKSASGQPTREVPVAKCDYPACDNKREEGELYCIAHNRKHTSFPVREVAKTGEFNVRAWLRKRFPDVREGFFNEIEDIVEAAYAAGRAADGTMQVSARQMDAVLFRALISPQDPPVHGEERERRLELAAKAMNELLRSHTAAGGKGTT